MTISRFRKLLTRADVEILTASSNEPDAIRYEAWMKGKLLFGFDFDVDGRRSIEFGSIGNVEFDANAFRDLINDGIEELTAWETELREMGGTWEHANQ